jgi:type II secretory pathway pseudopilin PulG
MREIRNRLRFRAHLSGARRRFRAQSGFALIEVVVSAALLLVVAGGVLAGIEGPANISTKNEQRSQATDLAQQDQERMRSMSFNSLLGYSATTPITVGKLTYSRASSAVWIRDNNDPDSCNTQAGSTTGDYLKISSLVTPPPGVGKPVRLDSLMAAPPSASTTKGTLAVLVTDQANQPVVNLPVSIAGSVNMTVPTNSIGCAVFGLVDQGNYTVSFSRTGWVDPADVNAVSFSTSVTANSTTIANHQYAQSGRINVSVDTKVGAAAPIASPAKGVMVANSGIPAGWLMFPAPATPAQGSSSFVLDVFPFPSGYGVWAGTCTSGDPTKYGLSPVTASPGPGGAVNVTVRQPSITVTAATGVPSLGTYPSQPNEHFVFTSIDTGCGEKRSQTAGTGGVVPWPGMPYGNYKVCGDLSNQYAQRNSFANTVAAGQSFTIPYVGNGVCP